MYSNQPTQTIWNVMLQMPRLATFTRHVHVDVAIVGAGITGLTAAALLKRAGKTVAVFEREEFGNHGTSHRTTAHLTEALDQDYNTLIRKFGQDDTRVAIDASRAAIETIETLARQLGFENEFRRVDGYRYTENHEQIDIIEEDFEHAKKLGIDARLLDRIPLPFKVKRAMVFPNQAQFHPVKHLIGLAQYVDGNGSYVFHKSPVREYEDNEPCKLTLDDGTVTATDLILATHTPMGIWTTLQTRLVPYHSYVMAVRLNGPAPLGLFWDTADPYHYIRRFSADDGDVLIVGGADNKTGQLRETESRFEALENYIREHFEIEEIQYHWSDQFFEPADGLPYIGKGPGAGHIYVATGYSGTGMTYGTAAAMLISDLILGRENSWTETFRPSRIKPIASAKHFLEEVGATVQGLIGERLKLAPKDIEDIPNQQGKVVSVDGKRVALYRDERGEMHALSPVCTHMGCMVEWNNAEKHWDCKCHGSLFKPDDGEPFSGPATKPLARREISTNHDEDSARESIRSSASSRKRDT